MMFNHKEYSDLIELRSHTSHRFNIFNCPSILFSLISGCSPRNISGSLQQFILISIKLGAICSISMGNIAFSFSSVLKNKAISSKHLRPSANISDLNLKLSAEMCFQSSLSFFKLEMAFRFEMRGCVLFGVLVPSLSPM
ncbi:hypothetical protein V8G54_010445 [Vigna mungo]|uniref:Uncharacterized protein n=1 Tax=Vigna mungo TaxID=3915 RepID=A0AAQ3S5S9_VIGMU